MNLNKNFSIFNIDSERDFKDDDRFKRIYDYPDNNNQSNLDTSFNSSQNMTDNSQEVRSMSTNVTATEANKK